MISLLMTFVQQGMRVLHKELSLWSSPPIQHNFVLARLRRQIKYRYRG